MSFMSGIYEGEISEARGQRWTRRRAVMLLADLDQAKLPERLGLAPKAEVEAQLRAAGLEHGGAVRALCSRDLAIYLCHGADGRLSALRYAVRAEGGEPRSWVVAADVVGGMARLYAEDGGRAYQLRLRPPAETVQVAVEGALAGGFGFAVSFLGRRRRAGPLAMLRVGSSRGLSGAIAEAMQAWQAPARDRRLAA